MKLYSYWRSGTSYRTRIALELKQIEYTLVPVDLRTGAHRQSDYLAINKQGLVPALVLENDHGTTICQSPAIIEYLEEYKPHPPLLPILPEDRATVRAMAAIIGCDTHPLNNLRILKHLKNEFGQDQDGINKWAQTWINDAFSTLESMIEDEGQDGDFCFGETPTIVDCYLIPQIYSAARFDVDMSQFPRLQAIDAACQKLDAFKKAHPDNQPDAD